jgi:chromate transporter
LANEVGTTHPDDPHGKRGAVAAISLVRLLAVFLKIGAIGFGGGMAVIALVEHEVVRKRRLLPMEEFIHGIALGQILGPLAVNASIFVGYRLFGPVAGLLCAVAFLTPSLTAVIVLSDLYFRYHSIPALQGLVAGLGPVVIALILSAGWSIGRNVLRSWFTLAIGIGGLLAGAGKLNPLWVLLAAGFAGFVFSPRVPPAGRAARPQTSGRGDAWMGLIAAPLASMHAITITFLKMGLVFFGGGFVLIPVLHDRLVTQLHWLTSREFLDGVAISNLTPGPIAVLATFAGYGVAGIGGALTATVALFAPAILLMMILSQQYARFREDRRVQRFLSGLNPAVVGLIVAAALLLFRGAIVSWHGYLLFGLSLFVLIRLRWHPAFVLAIGATGGYFGLLP